MPSASTVASPVSAARALLKARTIDLARLCPPRIDERVGRQEMQDHRIIKPKDFVGDFRPISEERDHRDNELLNDDFRCSQL